LTNNSASSDRRRIKLPPFDATWQGGSNELRFIFLQSLDAKLFNKIVESNQIKLNSKLNQIELNYELNLNDSV